MVRLAGVENLSLFALIYLLTVFSITRSCWESFIIRLDILRGEVVAHRRALRIFHYSPWYTYFHRSPRPTAVENLSLFALIYLCRCWKTPCFRWESFIIRLDILTYCVGNGWSPLRIFHYSPWYTYQQHPAPHNYVENLSLFALIYLGTDILLGGNRWESFIIRLDILIFFVFYCWR